MPDATTIAVENGHLAYLKAWLSVPVPRSQNRHRNEFLNALAPFAQDLEHNRVEIVRHYAELDDEGNPKLTDDGRTFVFKDAASATAAQSEYDALLKESVVITFSKPKAVEFARQFLSRMDHEMGYEEGQVYEKIAEALGLEEQAAAS